MSTHNDERGRGRGLSMRAQEALGGYLFLLPFFIGLVAIVAGPLLSSLYISMTDYGGFGTPNWIGIENYERAIDDPRMWKSASVTLTYVLAVVPCVNLVALLLAIALNRGIRFLGLYRAVYYVPSLIGSSVAVSLLWRQVFGADGLFNSALSIVGIEVTESWIGLPSTALGTLVVLQTWQFGSAMIIYLAALRQIPVSLYEAATVDGANRRQTFWFITLPMLAPIIMFNVTMVMISSFHAFNSAYVVSYGTGGPVDSTLFFTLFLFQEGVTNTDFGYASALGWILMVAIGVATASLLALTRRFTRNHM